ncbi:hypothetical protein [Paenibacillus kandeliae]|uniref:hypothetical protein n=1 Tax=Paenibacillus kandeliae TaxID=3231269 RepID=UPI00345801B9
MNINNLLLQHIISGQHSSKYLKENIPELVITLEKFFNTRSDIKRIQLSEIVCEKILEIMDFDDVIPLRSKVATLEIQRKINYKKQSDHTAHTLYLFLIGIWFYDNIDSLRNKIDSKIDSKKPIKMFLFQWTFASLLHDVGYLFYSFPDSSNKEYWNFFDEMLSSNFMTKQNKNLNQVENKNFQDVSAKFEEKYMAIKHSSQDNAISLIEQLENIPWITELTSKNIKGLELLYKDTENLPSLNEFAYRMAKQGYDGTPVVDHGVTGSLMLLKYTSAWYAIVNSNEPNAFYSKFNYYPAVFNKHIIPACRAIAFHNLPEFKFSLNDEPLLFLSVMCDELQIWDRFLSGSQHIDNWANINHCMAEDIETQLLITDQNQPKLKISIDKMYGEKIKESLDKRVNDWTNYISLNIK